jgi:hypothetical protein
MKTARIGNRKLLEQTTRATLPFDPVTRDIVLKRNPDPACWDDIQANIDQAVCFHSPTGFEFSYGGSGPADLALNILELFVPAGSDGYPPVKCYAGTVCSQTAWALHQDFKGFVARLPRLGGTIRGNDIEFWIKVNRAKVKCPTCYANPCDCAALGIAEGSL